MANFGSSSSGDLYNSNDFNDFLNNDESSSEDYIPKRQIKPTQTNLDQKKQSALNFAKSLVQKKNPNAPTQQPKQSSNLWANKQGSQIAPGFNVASKSNQQKDPYDFSQNDNKDPYDFSNQQNTWNFHQQAKRPVQSQWAFAQNEQKEGDAYQFNIDFSNIKAPSKEAPATYKQTPGIKSTLKKESTPKETKPKRGVTFNDYVEESQDSEWDKSENSSKKFKKSPLKGFENLPDDIKAMISPMNSESDSEQESSESEELQDSYKEFDQSQSSDNPVIKTEPFKAPNRFSSPSVQEQDSYSIDDSVYESISRSSDRSSYISPDQKQQLGDMGSSMGSSRSIKSKRLSSLRSSVRSDESKVSSIKSPIRIEEEVEFKPQPEILPKTELDQIQDEDLKKVVQQQGGPVYIIYQKIPENIPPPPDMDVKYQVIEYELNYFKQRVQQVEKMLLDKQDEIYQYQKKEIMEDINKLNEGELTDTRLKLQEAKNYIQLYKTELEQLMKELELGKNRVEELVQESRQKSEIIKQKNDEIVQLRYEKLQLERETKAQFQEDKVSEPAESDEKLKELKHRIMGLEQEIQYYQEDIEKLQDENIELKKSNEELKQNQQSIDILKKTYDQEKIENVKQRQNYIKNAEQQEILLVGFQKENEKLADQLKQLQKELNETKRQANLESQRLENLKINLINEHGGVFIKESRGSLPVINSLANGTVLNKEQFEKIQSQAKEYQQQVIIERSQFMEKEQQYLKQIEELQEFKNQFHDYLFQAKETVFQQQVLRIQQQNQLQLEKVSQDCQLQLVEMQQQLKASKEREQKSQEIVQKLEQEIQSQKPQNKDQIQQNSKLKQLEMKCRRLQHALKSKNEEMVKLKSNVNS